MLYHSGTAMDAGDYSYNSETGMVTIRTATFSTFSVAFDKTGVRTVTTADELEAALKDSSINTIKLGNNIKADVEIPSGKYLTLDLNGKTLTNSSDHTITVESGATLVITGTGTVDNITHRKAAIVNSGTVTLNGGTYTRSQESGASKTDSGENSYYTILKDNGGKMTINDGVKVENNGHFSSMIRNAGAKASTLVINGGEFSGGINTVKNDDYGILTINGGTFSNTSQYVVMNWHKATINGGSFEANSTAEAVLFSSKYYNQDDTTKTAGVLTINGATLTGTESQKQVVTEYTTENGVKLTGTVAMNIAE